MKESAIEKNLRYGVRSLGGLALKFVSPGRAGVPDRIVVWPDGTVDFVELKTIEGKLSCLQQITIKELESRGANVFVLYGSEAVTSYLNYRGHEHGV